MTVTDLTGTTWVFNNGLKSPSADFSYALNFISNNITYAKIQTNGFSGHAPVRDLRYNNTNVYVYDPKGWIDEAYKTISITGGADATNTNLINWLEANATKQESTPKVSVDLTTLPGWPSLSAGSHNITIVAKADGYTDSEPSTAVQVYKQPTGYTVSYVTEHGTTPGEKTQIQTLSATELPEISETGYTFGGWYYDSSFSVKASVGDALTQDVTLYAKWDVVQYTITVSGSHVTYTGPSKISYGGEATLVFTPTTGYTLPSAVSVQGASHYWNDLTGELQLSYPTGDVSIVISADLITYSVTRNLDSCSASNLDDIVAYGTNYSNTLTPSTGYTFQTAPVATMTGGGTLTVSKVGDTYTVSGVVTGDITITATALEKLATPTIELDGDELVLTSVDSRAQYMKIYRNGVLYDTVLIG